jgi:hypothetical protein
MGWQGVYWRLGEHSTVFSSGPKSADLMLVGE